MLFSRKLNVYIIQKWIVLFCFLKHNNITYKSIFYVIWTIILLVHDSLSNLSLFEIETALTLYSIKHCTLYSVQCNARRASHALHCTEYIIKIITHSQIVQNLYFVILLFATELFFKIVFINKHESIHFI